MYARCICSHAHSLYARYLCSRDALGLKAEQPVGQARRATIGYLVYKHTRPKGCSRKAKRARDDIGYLVYSRLPYMARDCIQDTLSSRARLA